MVPTHELAIQVADVFGSLMEGTGLNVLGLFGGVEQAPQIQRLKKGVDVLIATPGRMFDLASQGFLSFNKDGRYIAYYHQDPFPEGSGPGDHSPTNIYVIELNYPK